MQKAKINLTNTAIALATVSLLQNLALPIAVAQMPGAPGGPGAGPIDIVADEQEFAENSVIARGRVKVTYKDSVIFAPLATLYKDPEGNPNRAVFTGSPRLIQGKNKINAVTLTFEMKQNKIIADGNAHSEVEVEADEEAEKKASPLPISANTKPSSSAEETEDSENSDEENPVNTSGAQTRTGGSNAAKTTAKAKKPPEKIVTDSDKQEYDQVSGRFDAIGHVRVKHGDITVLADKLQLVYSAASNKPETALFSGHVNATQGRNMTSADNMSYSLMTKRLQATGHVKSKVIQEKGNAAGSGSSGGSGSGPDNDGEEGQPSARLDLFAMPAKASASKNYRQQAASTASADIFAGSGQGDNKPVWIFSDSQDYSKEVGRVSATGNVRVVSGDMYGAGPAIVLLKRPDGRAEKIKFIGRSQISQPGRRWIADEIVYLVDEQRVIANGNAKAMILQSPDGNGRVGGGGFMPNFNVGPNKKPAPAAPPKQDYRLAQPKPASTVSQNSKNEEDRRLAESKKKEAESKRATKM